MDCNHVKTSDVIGFDSFILVEVMLRFALIVQRKNSGLRNQRSGVRISLRALEYDILDIRCRDKTDMRESSRNLISHPFVAHSDRALC